LACATKRAESGAGLRGLKLADSFRLNPGSIIAMDRGYTDCCA
jgi:hypothetical protein